MMPALLRHVIWILTGSLLAVTPCANAQIVIDLQPDATVEGTVYRLGDIAAIRADDASVVHRLEETIIGRSPKVGHMGYVSRADLESRVRARLADAAAPIQWSGPAIVKLRTHGHELSPDIVTVTAEAALREWLSTYAGTATLRPVSEMKEILVPVGEVSVLASVDRRAHPASKMTVWVDVSVAGVHYRTIPIWFDVSVLRQVYKTGVELPPGHVLEVDDLEVTVADIATVKGQVWEVGVNVQGLRTTKWIAAASVLTEEALEPVPDVVKGQHVMVTATSGPVALQVPAVALRDGNVSDVIPVTRKQSYEEFRVLVTGKGQAVVAEVTNNEN